MLHYPSHDDSAAKRIASYMSFAASTTAFTAALAGCDVCLVYCTPATVAIPAVVLNALAGVPFVLYVQDLWPDSVTASGFVSNPRGNHFMARQLSRYCNGIYRRASAVVGISPAMSDLLRARGVDEHKVATVYNWVDESVFKPAPRSNSDSSRFELMYAGGIGEVQGLENAIEAMNALRDRDDVRLTFVGRGVAEPGLRRRVAELGLEHSVRFCPPRTTADMAGVIASADAQLVSLRGDSFLATTLPSKLQASMACGAPIICAAPGAAAQLVAQAHAGIAVEPDRPSALAGAIAGMAAASKEKRAVMGRNGLAYYNRNLSRSVGAARLADILARACADRRPNILKRTTRESWYG
ncbi:glycosyltransferase involved in cell wall biosynthesis [Actinopolymorpha cephalotaxi]|uniref:Glycosyltransferase involved in cell wall biosynthesis n=1 Tax=Actinopolymorpha cephalotaxi TaxID=504797 RepID=A0ABX2S5P6_9ACTN|nr:glycosyltransferase involved in cell wall biosynthesis [Actinopolymorpha cephalotaxi]